MSLAERIEEATSPPSKPCKYARIISALRETDDHADEFDQMVMDGRIDGSKAAAALAAEGHYVADTVVRKHIGGTCCCNR